MKYIEPNFKGLLLNLTDACNLECIYCFVQQQPHYMTYQVAKDSVDLLIEINKKRKNKIIPSIAYFGGEPTLMWDPIIVPLTKYIREELKEPFEINMTSNCILLDDEKIDFIKKYKINLLFSVDGDKETQDFNRPCHDKAKSSFDILSSKFLKISKNFPNTTFRSTLMPQTCQNLYKNIMFAAEKGFQHYFACPNDFIDWTAEDIKKLKLELRKYSLYYINGYRKDLQPIEFSPITLSFYSIFEYLKNNNAKRTVERCGMGTLYASVNYEGKLFGCQQMPSYGEQDNLFYIGDIYNGLIKENLENLHSQYLSHSTVCHNLDQCQDCKLFNTCQKAYCHSNSYLLYNNLYEKAEIRCIWDKMLFDEALFIMQVLGNNNNQQFLKAIEQVIRGK